MGLKLKKWFLLFSLVSILPCLQLLGDLKKISLQDVFNLGYKHSEDISLAKLNEKLIKNDVLSARAYLFPKVSLLGSWKEYEGNTRTSNPLSSWSLDYHQRLVDFSAYSIYKASQDYAKSSEFDTFAKVEIVMLKLAKLYYENLRFNNLLKIAKSNLSLSEEQVEIVSARYDNGEVSKNELLQVESEYSQALSDLLALENSVTFLKEELSSYIGLASDEYELEQHSYVEKENLIDKTAEELIKKALLDRSEIFAVTNKLNALKTNFKSQKRSFWPTLDLDAANNFTNDSSTVGKKDYWSMAFTVKFPFYQGGKVKSDINKSLYQYKQLEVEYNNLSREICLEVQKSLLDSKTSLQKLATIKKRLDLEDENYKIVKKRYQAGELSSFELLLAYHNQSAVKAEMVNIESDLEYNYLSLKRAIGSFQEDCMVKG